MALDGDTNSSGSLRPSMARSPTSCAVGGGIRCGSGGGVLGRASGGLDDDQRPSPVAGRSPTRAVDERRSPLRHQSAASSESRTPAAVVSLIEGPVLHGGARQHSAVEPGACNTCRSVRDGRSVPARRTSCPRIGFTDDTASPGTDQLRRQSRRCAAVALAGEWRRPARLRPAQSSSGAAPASRGAPAARRRRRGLRRGRSRAPARAAPLTRAERGLELRDVAGLDPAGVDTRRSRQEPRAAGPRPSASGATSRVPQRRYSTIVRASRWRSATNAS